MKRATQSWVPEGVGEVDEAMYYHYILLSASE